jgi:biotin carboxyl carrier protein
MRKETLLSPLTGIIAQVYTPTGTIVQVNDEILSVECMKLFYPVSASINGKLELKVNVGEYVEESQEIGFILGD